MRVLVVSFMLVGACVSGDAEREENTATSATSELSHHSGGINKDQTCGGRALGSWPPAPIKGGIVGETDRAIALGAVYLVGIYGKDTVRLPLSAELKNGVWRVEDDGPGKGAVGGSRYIEICQSNGAVLSTFETQ